MVQSVVDQQSNQRRSAERTCVGCARVGALAEMVRVVLLEGGEGGPSLVVDAKGRSGRGAHVHPQFDCIVKACRGGFSRSFRKAVRADAAKLCGEIRVGFSQRIQGLLVAARGARLLEVGADAACEALEHGAPLVVVAADAGTVIGRTPIADAIAQGRAVVWKNKEALGRSCGREDVAVVAVCDERIARAIRSACAVVDGMKES